MGKKFMYCLTKDGIPLLLSEGETTIHLRRKEIVLERLNYIEGRTDLKLLNAKIDKITFFDKNNYTMKEETYLISKVEVI